MEHLEITKQILVQIVIFATAYNVLHAMDDGRKYLGNKIKSILPK